jgi:hypothetical protein
MIRSSIRSAIALTLSAVIALAGGPAFAAAGVMSPVKPADVSALRRSLPAVVPTGNITTVGTNGTLGSPAVTSGSWSGTGRAIGPAPGAFNELLLTLRGWDASTPTVIRARLRAGSSSGTVLSESYTAIPPGGANQGCAYAQCGYDVVFQFGRVTRPADGNLYLELLSDGHFTTYGISGTPYSYATEQLSSSGDVNTYTLSNTSTSNARVTFRLNSALAALNDKAGQYGTTWWLATSTFYGFCWGLDVAGAGAQPFNRIAVDVQPNDPNKIPTQFRLFVTSGSPASVSNTKLVDVTQSLASPLRLGVSNRISFDLSATVGGPNLVACLISDGHFGPRRTNAVNLSTSFNPGWYAAAAAPSITAPNLVSGQNIGVYFQTQLIDKSGYQPSASFASVDAMSGLLQAFNAPIQLPGTLYAVQGEETNLYFKSLLRLPSSRWSDMVRFEVTPSWDADSYGLFDQRWSFTPVVGDVGAKTLNVTAYLLDQQIATVNAYLTVKNNTAAATRKVLSLGDSETVEGLWVAEMVNRAGTYGLTLTPIGTQATSGVQDAGSDGKGVVITLASTPTVGASTLTVAPQDAASFLRARTVSLTGGVSENVTIANTATAVNAQTGVLTLTGTVANASHTAINAGSTSRSGANEARGGKTALWFATDPTSPFAKAVTLSAQSTSSVTLSACTGLAAGSLVNLSGGTASEYFIISAINTGTCVVTPASTLNYTNHTAGNYFDLSTYLTTNGFTMASSDWLLLNFGTNEIALQNSDAAARSAISISLAAYKSMIQNAKSSVSGIRVGIMTTPPPATHQDAWGVLYPGLGITGGVLAKYSRYLGMMREAQIATFDAGAYDSNVFVAPSGAGVDPEFTPTKDLYPNRYSLNKQQIQANTVHYTPAGFCSGSTTTSCYTTPYGNTSGYYQEGGMIAQWLRGQEP